MSDVGECLTSGQGKGFVMKNRESVADQVEKLLLHAVVRRELTSGETLNDQHWSEVLGVSRTPVREAIQRLRWLGLLNVAAARYTRMLSFTPDTAYEEAHNWSAAHETVISSLIPTVTTELLGHLHTARDSYHTGDRDVAHFNFFDILREASPNYGVRLGAKAAAYRLKLAETHLQHHHVHVTELHDAIITALESKSMDAARTALSRWVNALTQTADAITAA